MNSWRLLPPILLLIAIVASWTTASASTITLSNASNGPGLDASLLAATVQFEVTDPSTLTLTVSNDSANYDVVAVFFNAAANVTGLSLASGPKDWKLEDSSKKGNPSDADSFGTFDYVVWVKGKGETVGAFHTPESGSRMLLGLGLVALAITGRKRSQNAYR